MGKKKIRLALVGVGNCACSLVQGIEFYKTPEIAEEAGGDRKSTRLNSSHIH